MFAGGEEERRKGGKEEERQHLPPRERGKEKEIPEGKRKRGRRRPRSCASTQQKHLSIESVFSVPLEARARRSRRRGAGSDEERWGRGRGKEGVTEGGERGGTRGAQEDQSSSCGAECSGGIRSGVLLDSPYTCMSLYIILRSTLGMCCARGRGRKEDARMEGRGSRF